MSEYEWEGPLRMAGCVDRVSTVHAWPGPKGRVWLSAKSDQVTAALLPSDPAELHKLTEAILGRKVAAVIYEDELPEVEPNGRIADTIHGSTHYSLDAMPAERARELSRQALAAALAIEARDAAAKEQERAEEERVGRLAEALHAEFRSATGTRTWHDLHHEAKEGWVAVARHVLASEEAGR